MQNGITKICDSVDELKDTIKNIEHSIECLEPGELDHNSGIALLEKFEEISQTLKRSELIIQERQ